MERHPAIGVDVTTGFSSDLLEQLGTRYDLVLSTHPLGKGKGERLRVEKTRWMFSREHRLPVSESIPLALLPPGNLFRTWAVEALDRAGMHWHALFTSSSIAAVEAAAAAGIAVCVAKEGSVREDLRPLDSRHGLPELPDTEIMLNRTLGRNPSATKALGDFLAQSMMNS